MHPPIPKPAFRNCAWLGCWLLLAPAVAGVQAQEVLEQVVVTGTLPGPALWQVINGDNVLWIFPRLSPTPKDMTWEAGRVARVIAAADEYLEPPGAHVSVSSKVMFNPVNYFRVYRLANRLAKNPGDKPLQDVLPPEMYQRFSALQERYFPEDDEVGTLRPIAAVGHMDAPVLRKNGLTDRDDIMKSIMQMVGDNRHIRRTVTELDVEVKGGYGTLATRVETYLNSLPPEQELACMDFRLTRLESGIGAMKSRANSWALGHMDEFRNEPRVASATDPCFSLVTLSSEGATFAQVTQDASGKWLSAAERALARSHTTFAVLDIGELFDANGLLAQLKSRGYEVREP